MFFIIAEKRTFNYSWKSTTGPTHKIMSTSTQQFEYYMLFYYTKNHTF